MAQPAELQALVKRLSAVSTSATAAAQLQASIAEKQVTLAELSERKLLAPLAQLLQDKVRQACTAWTTCYFVAMHTLHAVHLPLLVPRRSP